MINIGHTDVTRISTVTKSKIVNKLRIAPKAHKKAQPNITTPKAQNVGSHNLKACERR